MHILIIPSWYKTERNPVSGSFFEEQARALSRAGCRVGVFHAGFRSFSDLSSRTNRKYNDNGLNTVQFEVKALIPYSHTFNYWYLCFRAYREFEAYVKEHGKPDVIHAHSVFWGGIVAAHISKRAGIPFVITEHLTDFVTGKFVPSDKKAALKVFQSSAQNIVVSTGFKTLLCKTLGLPEAKFSVIPNMVAPVFFNPSRVLEKKIQAPAFFTNSFISERKNIDLILRSFKIVLDKYPNASLWIGGDAVRDQDQKYKGELLQLSSFLNLKDRVIFLGPLSREEVRKTIAKSDIFLLASKFETFGVVLIEALAGGIPVISTDSTGPRDIINGDNGLLVSSFSEKDLSEAMLSMVENYGRYNSGTIIDHCKNNFSEEVIVGKLLGVYRKAVVR